MQRPLARLPSPPFHPLLARTLAGALIKIKSSHFLDIDGDLDDRSRRVPQVAEAVLRVRLCARPQRAPLAYALREKPQKNGIEVDALAGAHYFVRSSE